MTEDQTPARSTRRRALQISAVLLVIAGAVLIFLASAAENDLLEWSLPSWLGGPVIGVGVALWLQAKR